jgi:beta-galactosidase
VGPQFALYTPAPWLLSGSNDLVFFDLKGDRQEALKTGLEPIYAMPVASEAR